MVDLKPCPFCGGKAELIIVPGYFKQGLSSSGWLVKCLAGCCNQMPYTSDHDAIDAWNRRAEETPPQPIGEVECVMCGDTFTETELAELREMGEAYHHEEGCFLCPDCWDSFQRMDPEEQLKMAMVNGWKELRREG